MKLPWNNVSPGFIARNPHLFGVGQLPTVQRKQSPDAPLVKDTRRKRQSKRGVVIRCSIVQCRHQLLDTDNAVSGGTKALRDAIAKMCGLDDADGRIEFEYGQLHTSGREGCIVKLELV